MNPFEAGTRKLIPAVLIYVRQGDRILMLHRNAADRSGDVHAGKWNGLGGKLELDESAQEAAQRELQEESSLDLPLDSFKFLGVLHFPNFKAQKHEDWIVTVFTTSVTSELGATVPKSGCEGDLHWIHSADLLTLNLWAGDRHFLPHVVTRTPFSGTIWYAGETVKKFSVQPLGV